MAENKKSFILYSDQQSIFNDLTDQEAGKLIKFIYAYVNDENPVTDDRIVQIAFGPIKQQLKRDLEKWETERGHRSDAGRIGGIKSGESRRKLPKQNEANEASASNSKQTQANEAVSVNDSVNVNANVTASVNGNVNEEGITPAPAKVSRKKREPSQQPVVFRESEYFNKEKFSSALAGSGPPYCNANPDFYYDACLNGSDSRGYKYLDWIAAVKNWMRKDIATGKFQSIISEPIKIVQGGKSNYKSERKAGYSDDELLSGLEDYRRRNQVANS